MEKIGLHQLRNDIRGSLKDLVGQNNQERQSTKEGRFHQGSFPVHKNNAWRREIREIRKFPG